MFIHSLIFCSFFIFGYSGIYWRKASFRLWYLNKTSSSYPLSSSTRGSTAAPTVAPKTVYCNNYRDLSIKEFPKVGDLICKAPSYAVLTYRYRQPDELILREAFLKPPMAYPSRITYQETINGDVSSVNISNFGKVHGFVKQIVIRAERYAGTSVTADIDVPQGHEVKMFVEIYGKKFGKKGNSRFVLIRANY